MPLKQPLFWKAQKSIFLPLLFMPLALCYEFGSYLRTVFTTPYKSRIPVICVGNFTIGGGGKTPFVDFLAAEFRKENKSVCILSRGYKGREEGPLLIDPDVMIADQVGDEPVMLAMRGYDVVISKNKQKGLQFIEGLKRHDYIVMDDGLQNSTIYKDFSICMIDAHFGFGNGFCFPAGPLRRRLTQKQIDKVDFFVISGASAIEPFCQTQLPKDKVLRANVVIDPESLIGFKTKTPLVGFAGIANPDKFFDMLEAMGYHFVKKIAYSDHHHYTKSDLKELATLRRTLEADLITTEKDIVKLDSLYIKEHYVHHVKISLDVPKKSHFWQVFYNKLPQKRTRKKVI